MRKTITVKYLDKIGACTEAKKEFLKQKERDTFELFDIMIKSNKKLYLQWANWLIVRLMTKRQRIKYAIYAAKKVLHIFEEKYPDDKRPREAIKAVENYLKNPTAKNKKTAAAAAYAAAYAYAYAAAYAAAAYADTDAYAAAAYAAAAYATCNKIKIKILKFGIKLLKEIK